jgi:hypothetical protein
MRARTLAWVLGCAGLVCSATWSLWWTTSLHITRPMRTGNALFEHAYIRLMARQRGTSFVDINSWHLRRTPFSTVLGAGPRAPVDMSMPAENPEDAWHMDFRMYRPHRAFLKAEVFPRGPVALRFDLAVHVRLGDVFDGHPLYTVLPLSFYRRALANVRGLDERARVAVLGNPTDEQQRGILRDVARAVHNATGASPRLMMDNSVQSDFDIIAASAVLIASTSSFWIWPGFLSDVQREVHMPAFGQALRYHLCENLQPGDLPMRAGNDSGGCALWLADEGRFWDVRLYPLGFVSKISSDQVRQRMYD